MFHPDSRLVRILTAAAGFVALNLVWLLCSLPVFTIGPAAAALYTVTRKMARREDPVVAAEFFRAFRRNFGQALLLGLILLVPMLLLGTYLFLSFSGVLAARPGLRGLCVAAAVVVGVVWSYVWPLQAWFENSPGGTLRNAMLLPLGSPLVAAAVTVLNLFPAWLLVRHTEYFLRTGFFWLFAGGALFAFLNTQLLRLQLRAYLPEDEFRRKRDGEDES